MCCDADPPVVYDHNVRRAAKPHRCCECGRYRIAKGDIYHEHRGLWDGRWETFRRCMRCENVATALSKESECSPCFTGVRYDLRMRTHDRHCYR